MTDPHRLLKNAFGRYATGVTVVGCRDAAGAYAAITVNSFTSVSLTPPLVLWSIEKSASTFPAFMAADSYAVSVLKSGQADISQRFATRGALGMQDDEIETWRTGSPLLKDRLAGFDCKVVDRHAAGDHFILVGEVIEYDAKPGAPLLYFASDYADGPTAP